MTVIGAAIFRCAEVGQSLILFAVCIMAEHANAIYHPPGFRSRRGLNWAFIGLLYASFYMCRYNFSIANGAISKEFGFSKADMGVIITTALLAYACGQIINGLLADRLGGKRAMLIGAAGTVVMNVLFGVASFWGMLWMFVTIRAIDGYLQAFGAPGMVKINAAWFSQRERGRFAGIFGFMIQLGQVAINNLAPIILAGFTIGAWIVAKGDWRWLFRLPPLVTAVMAILVALVPKESPEQAGFPGCVKDENDSGAAHSDDVRVGMKESFLTIFRHPLVWFYALAYACTGVVRQSSEQLPLLFFDQYLHFDVNGRPPSVTWTMNIAPLIAVLGSFISGVVSDKVFRGHRSPVAMGVATARWISASPATLSGQQNWGNKNVTVSGADVMCEKSWARILWSLGM
jgi:OPA family glycerol-3-phosphate transporter-like MFS transporter